MGSIKMTTETQLPQGWEIKKFGDVIDIQGGSQPPKSEFIYEPKENYIQLLQIRDFGENGVPTFVPKNRVTKFCDKDDILIARYGASLGRIVTGLSGAYNVALAKTIFDDGVLFKRFVYYLLQTQIFQVPLTMISRSAQNGFAKHEIAHIEIPIPPLETQQAIVNKIESLFAEIDAGIASLKTAQQQLKHYRQSLLKNAFNGELTKQWRLENADRLPSAIELLAQIQTAREQYHVQQLADWQTAVQQWEQAGKQGKKPSKPTLKKITVGISDNELVIPEKQWFIGLFGDLVEIKSNLVQPERYLDFPHIAPDNIEKETGKLLSFKTIKDDGVISPKHYFYAGQIIYSKIRPNLSKLVLVDFDGLCSADMYPLESDVFNHHFLKYMMLSRYFVKKASTAGSRSVLPKINQSELSMIPLPICSLAEQTQIVAILESKLTACDQLASELATQLKQAELLKQAVLKAAFEGKLIRDNHNE